MEEFYKQMNFSLGKNAITLSDAISLDSSNSSLSISDLPSYMLRRIMLLDTSSRNLPSLPINPLNGSASTIINDNPLSTFLDEEDEDGVVHPMDVFLYIFLKSHPTFRQTLVNQISKCLLSLPLITYDSISNEVTFNHFAFQTLILNRYIDEDSTKAFSAVGEPFPIVSFMRFCDCENSQKSEFLNRILKIKHSYFFHKDCCGNAKKRYLLNGTVEVAWYLPNWKETGIIKQHFIMLNLRGNACKFPKQREFLGEISNVVYVFVPLSELTQDIAKQLVEIHDKSKAKVIFLIYKGSSNINPYPECIPNILNDKQKTIGLKKKTTCQNLELIESSISQSIDKERHIPQTLTGYIQTATRFGISVDTMKEEILSNQRIVDATCKDIQHISMHEGDVSSCKKSLGEMKQRLLPLQAKFGDWAEANRDIQQGGKSEFEEYYQNLEKMRIGARSSQIELLSKPSTLFSQILKQCPRSTKDKFGFYLYWELLKNYLNVVSRKHLPILYNEYKKWLVESYSYHSNSADRDEMEAKSNLFKTAELITQSSFGIEHIFREIGQAYEAYSICDVKRKTVLKHQLNFCPTLLPGIMANLILQGHSFEIVNGDVNHVPLQWVSEVLSSLTELIGSDKKLFVISVLGIQSSGKSTLLNTMFGINFPVSSGRCTRGVFMQMIKVKKSLKKELGYDYLVLLDTEGLRAPELSGSLSYKRDNEMATFIVGLGDIALINIKGESHSEVQDILEITVIAFIRMKLTHGKPKCLFVHQNVGDIQAKDNLMIARKSLIDTLNEMTTCAAQQENKEFQFSRFCDVIEFNPEKDIFYFPGLFEGESPMTSIAPGYIKNAEELRTKLIGCCSNQDRNFLNVDQWKKKLCTLWNSVLNENFVFSYKNMLELNCRFELDISLSSWYSHFAQEMAGIKSKYFNKLSNVENCQIQATLETILNELFEISDSLSSEMEKKIMDFYFVEHDKKLCFQQWDSKTKRYFKSCRDREQRKVKEECDTIFRVEKQKIIIDEKFSNFKNEIMTKVRNLYEHKEDKVSFESEDSVQIYFEEIWNELVSQIQLTKIECANIARDLQQVLREFPYIQQLDVFSEKKFLIKDVDKFEVLGTSEFEELFQIYDVQPDYNYYKILDLQTHKSHIGQKVTNIFRSILSWSKEEKTKKSEFKKLRSIIQTLDSQINAIVDRFPPNSNYCVDYFRVLIDQSVKAITDQNKSERANARESFILTNHFIFDFVFYQCCKAIKNFEILQERYLDQNSLEVKLCILKGTLKSNFSQLCTGIRSEDICAESLTRITLDGMKQYLQDTILQSLLHLFINDLEHGTIYISRAFLQLAVLKELARKKDFDSYLQYIEHPFDYINSFIRRNILEYSQKTIVINNILSNLDIKVQELMKKYIEAAKFEPMDLIYSWESWKLHYHDLITNYVRGVKMSDLGILDIHNVSNYAQFYDLFKVAMEHSCKAFDWRHWVEEILATGNFKDIQETITNSLIECRSLCPFCREPCQLTAGEHEHYCSSFHRPNGISGWRYLCSKEICIEECTKNILLNRNFYIKMYGTIILTTKLLMKFSNLGIS